MLFRTKFAAAFAALALVAISSAALLIRSSQLSELNQKRMTLAYESLAGYYLLSGDVFRTFKQARRDLVSGSGRFAFDFADAEASVLETLAEIEEVSQAEASFILEPQGFNGLAHVRELREEIREAFSSVRDASVQILSGDVEAGRSKAIGTLEGRVDAKIATLIESAIDAERRQLSAAQDEIAFINAWSRTLAWIAVMIALLLSALVLLTLVRRFSTSLKALDAGAQEYASGNLDHVIALPGNDELSDVASRFSEMAQQILAKRQSLENAQQELERRVAERTAELSDVNNELHERERHRRQFFADIGHEFRTPVTAIRGEAEVALRAKDNVVEAQRQALTTIVSLSEQLTDNVGDLFLIAREQAGVLDFRNQRLDLNGPTSLGVEQMRSLADRRHARIIETMSEKSVAIEGDSNRIAQLVRILISNALSHAPSGVEIEVSTLEAGAEAVLVVLRQWSGHPGERSGAGLRSLCERG